MQKTQTDSEQSWVASPYHARMGRDAIRLMPESMLPWCEEDAQDMCALLNPWLKDEGMALEEVGAALRLICNRVWDVQPLDFPFISAGELPNRHPKGRDGGHWMRLQSEIQMVLNQSPLQARRQRGEADIHGLWFWGSSSQKNAHDDQLKTFPVATRHVFLQSLVEAQGAKVILTESEKLALLLHQDGVLPKHVFLLGAGYMIHLEPSIWTRLRPQTWQPHDLKEEEQGLQMLRQYC